MAKKDELQTEWKRDRARAERKERLASLKDKDGNKKKISSKSVAGRVTAVILAVILVLVIVVWALARYGVLQKKSVAVTIGDQSITAADLNIELGNFTMLSQMGMAFTEEMQHQLDSPTYTGEDRTLREDLIDHLLSLDMKTRYAQISAMRADESFKLTDEQENKIKEQIDQFAQQIEAAALQTGRPAGRLMAESYGPGITMDHFNKYLRQTLELQFYLEYMMERFEVSEAEIDAYYEEHKADYLLYNYKSYAYTADVTTDMAEEKKKALIGEVEQRANKALEVYLEDEEKDFATAMAKYETDSDKRQALKDDPESVVQSRMTATQLPSVAGEWLKDTARKAGDTTVIAGSDRVWVLEFEGSEEDTAHPFNVRHIFIAPKPEAAEGEQPTEEEREKADEKAREQAESILNEYRDGAQTEEAFIELVKKYTEDTASQETGGLYEHVDRNAQFVKEFKNWGIEKELKPGDVELVKTDLGYHIMYFVGYDDELAYRVSITDKLQQEKYLEWSKELTEGVELTRHNFGMKFVGRSGFFQSLFGSVPQPAPTPTAEATR